MPSRHGLTCQATSVRGARVETLAIVGAVRRRRERDLRIDPIGKDLGLRGRASELLGDQIYLLALGPKGGLQQPLGRLFPTRPVR